MTDEARDRIVRALSAEVSPLRDEGAALAVDHVLGLPLRELLDLPRIRAIVLGALTAENLGVVIERHVHPGFVRYGTAARRSGETVGDLVPPSAVDDIGVILGKSRVPEAEWARGMVDPALVRRLFGPVWMHVLLSFAKRLPVPGAGVASAATGAVGRGALGIAGKLSRQAEKIVDAGRNVMGGLGAEVEKRFQAAARDFSDGAQEIFREALRDRLKSDEGREIVSAMREQVLERVMKTELRKLQEDVDRAPVADILRLVPGIVAHARTRPFIAGVVDGEVDAFLEAEGARSLREILSEFGVLDEARDATLEHVNRVARGLAATPGFAEWVGRLLAV